MRLSVVIASHLNPQGLYLTTFSTISQLQKDFQGDCEVIIAADGGSPAKWENIPGVRCLRIKTGSPQGTRDAGIRAAQGETILVLEDHVVVSDIKCLYESHIENSAAMTFCSRRFESGEFFNAYGTETDWDGNLWFKRTIYKPQHIPRPVVQFGHSCFMLDRQSYTDVGGYTSLLSGYGGEETLLCLKFWMMGYQCWMEPRVWQAHYLSDNGMGAAMASEQFQKNFKIVKYVLTGESGDLQITTDMMQERQRIISGPFNGQIENLKKYFLQEGIS